MHGACMGGALALHSTAFTCIHLHTAYAGAWSRRGSVPHWGQRFWRQKPIEKQAKKKRRKRGNNQAAGGGTDPEDVRSLEAPKEKPVKRGVCACDWV